LDQRKIVRNRFFYPIVVLLAWTAFGLFFGTQNYLRDVYVGKTPSLTRYLVSWIICGYSWAILTLPVLWFARIFPFGRLKHAFFFPIHILAGGAFSLIQLGVYVAIASVLFNRGDHSIVDYYKFLLASEFQSSFLVYFAIIATVYLYDHFFGARRNEPAGTANVIEIQGNVPNGIETYYSESNGNGTAIHRISVKENGRIVLVDVGEIDWITSEGNYVNLHTRDKKYMVRDTMNAMEKKLDRSEFVRIRRSAIVRIQEIKEFHPMFNGEYEVILRSGASLTSSRRYRKNLELILKC